MEKEVKKQMDFLLQWGNRKRLRCVKVRGGGGLDKRIGSRVNRHRVIRVEKESPWRSQPQPDLIHSHRKSHEDSRFFFYTTRGSLVEGDEKEKEREKEKEKGMVLPRFFVSLSSKQKEEDFMAMKGCKLPQRPKKRPKFIQNSIFLVSPGAWLSDISQERYEVREKKSSRKTRRGLKAMRMQTESDLD